MRFGENLREIRKIRKISQEKLAQMLSVSRQSVSKWECGDAYPEMKHILALCELFNCNINDLVHNDMSDLQLMDEDVQQSVVKFKREKQVKVQLICKVIEILASIWKYVSILCFPVAIVIMLGLPTWSKRISLIDLMNELEFQTVSNWSEISRLLVLEGHLFSLLIIAVLHYFTAKLIIKLCKNFYQGSTPYTLTNVNTIKRITIFISILVVFEIITTILFDSLKANHFIFSVDLFKVLFILVLILILNIFEYGYELQLNTKYQMIGEVDDIETTQTKLLDYVNKNVKKYLIGIGLLCVIGLCGFLIFKPNYDPQIPVILQLEELGYQKTKINHLDFVEREDYSAYHLDLENKKDKYQVLNVSVIEYKNKEDAVNTFENILVEYKKTSILRNDYTLSEEDNV